MNAEFLKALEQIEKQKGISKQILLEAVEQAVLNAYKKNYGSNEDVTVKIDEKTGEIKAINHLTVVDDEKEDIYENEVTLEYANEFYGKGYNIGDVIEEEKTPANFGRIATQTARQIVVQKIKEAEKDIQFEQFKQKQGEIITGTISRIARNTVYVDISIIGSNDLTIVAEAVLPMSEQIGTDDYHIGQRLKCYISEVKKNNNKIQIILSRVHQDFVRRLFELEVPEIYDGIVELVSIAREAGSRTKMAVKSNMKDVDPVGACIGSKGQRVRNVVEEINDEKIDIIEYNEDPVEYISASLLPAKVNSVTLSEDGKIANVVVPDDKLSLAIGKEGQNVRLAARLTNYKIDIKSQSQADEELLNPKSEQSIDKTTEETGTDDVQERTDMNDNESSYIENL